MRKASLFGAPFTPVSGLGHRRIPLRGLGQVGEGQVVVPPQESCPDQQVWDGTKCIPRPAPIQTPSGRAPAACRNADGSWSLYDTDSRAFLQTVENKLINGLDYPYAQASIASPGFCELAAQAAQSAPATTTDGAPSRSTVQPPGPAQSPESRPNVVSLPPAADLTARPACDPSAWMRSYPARMGEVKLRRGLPF